MTHFSICNPRFTMKTRLEALGCSARDNRSRFRPFFWSGMSFPYLLVVKSPLEFAGHVQWISSWNSSAGCLFFQSTDSFNFGIHIRHNFYSVHRAGVKSRGPSSAYRALSPMIILTASHSRTRPIRHVFMYRAIPDRLAYLKLEKRSYAAPIASHVDR